jgi:hypothetical protein
MHDIYSIKHIYLLRAAQRSERARFDQKPLSIMKNMHVLRFDKIDSRKTIMI